MFDKEDK